MKWFSALAIALLGAVLVAGWLVSAGDEGAGPGPRTADVAGGAADAAALRGTPLRPQSAEAPAPGHVARTTVTAAAPPPGVSTEQWQQIVAEHAGRPDGAAELQRLADYFQFADTMQRFRKLRRASAPGAELAPLAREIDRSLDVHLQRGEVNGGEARAIKLAVLEVLQPDEGVRQAALRQWQATATPMVPQAAEARARDAEYLRQRAAVVAAWSARAPAERDQRALERDLAALKQATYAPTGERNASPASSRRTP